MLTHEHADTHAHPGARAPLHAQGRHAAEAGGQALTCLEMMSFPSGMGAPFSVAILFKVAMAFSWFPDSTSYLALSGSHCGDSRPKHGQLGKSRTLGPSNTLICVWSLKGGGSGARELASNLDLPLNRLAV